MADEKTVPILVLEPSFLHLPLSAPILGAKRTVIAPAWLLKKNKGEQTISFLEPSYTTLSQKNMNLFVKKALTTLSEELTSVSLQWLRDNHGVIQIALLESPSPITASIILAPNFATRFTPIFGPELLIAIPSSHRIFVFSKLIPPMNSIAPKVRDEYKLSLNPITTEFFELSHGQLRAMGSFD